MDRDQDGHTTNLAELRQARDILKRWEAEWQGLFTAWENRVDDDTQGAMNAIREIARNEFVRWGFRLDEPPVAPPHMALQPIPAERQAEFRRFRVDCHVDADGGYPRFKETLEAEGWDPTTLEDGPEWPPEYLKNKPSSPFAKPIEEWTEEDMARDEVDAQGIPARVYYNKYMAEKKARTYRIPGALAKRLWDFEEGPLVYDMERAFDEWMHGKMPDKDFLVLMQEDLKLLADFRSNVLTPSLAEAIYDGNKGEAIEWTEPPPDPKDDPDPDLPF